MSRRRHHKKKQAPAMEAEATISSLGRQGDGVALVAGRTVHVPFTVPGDEVLLNVRGAKGQIKRFVKSGANRRAPPCAHFGPEGDKCGGCALMHLDTDYYSAWKQGLVRQALAREGLSDVEVKPVLSSPPRSRRRAGFAVSGQGAHVRVGFKARQSHKTVAVNDCEILVPDLLALLHKLPAALAPVSQRVGKLEGTAHVTLCANGIDLDFAEMLAEEDLDLAAREEVTQIARALDLARLTLNEMPFYEARAPQIVWAETPVALPPRAFLQATLEGEQALQEIVTGAAAGATRAVDLFAGCGTFTFALAREMPVHAVESVAPAVAAMERARVSSGLQPISTVRRDLFEQPLRPEELKGVDFVVFDPPRAGAEAQARQLAKSDVPVVVGVSCNPLSFARDAKALVDGGYKLFAVQPVDQFLYAPHIEVAAVFTR